MATTQPGRYDTVRPAAILAVLTAAGARLPGFHTCVGGGGERQAPEWYESKGERRQQQPTTAACQGRTPCSPAGFGILTCLAHAFHRLSCLPQPLAQASLSPSFSACPAARQDAPRPTELNHPHAPVTRTS